MFRLTATWDKATKKPLSIYPSPGAKLRTGQGARAEIEFEDGSSLRLTPASVLEFPELALRDSGARTSSVVLQQGTAYLNFKGDKGEQFVLGFGPESLTLKKPSHLRLELRDASATVAVFNGAVEVNGASGKVDVEKKHSATFESGRLSSLHPRQKS